MKRHLTRTAILLLTVSIQAVKADIHVDFGYGFSKPFSEYYGESFFGGMIAGLRYDFAFRDSMLWDFGLSYVKRGGRDKITIHSSIEGGIDNGWSIFEYDYLSVPILFKYRNPRPKYMRTSFFIGPRFDFRLNFKHRLELKGHDVYGYCIPSESKLNSFIFGAKTGLEFQPFFESPVGPTIRAGAEIDFSPLTQSEESYTVKTAIDLTGGIVIRPKRIKEGREEN